MPDNFGSGKGSNKAPTGGILDGLSNKSPKFADKSLGMKGGESVNSDTIRSTTAPTPKTLGPRVA